MEMLMIHLLFLLFIKLVTFYCLFDVGLPVAKNVIYIENKVTKIIMRIELYTTSAC